MWEIFMIFSAPHCKWCSWTHHQHVSRCWEVSVSGSQNCRSYDQEMSKLRWYQPFCFGSRTSWWEESQISRLAFILYRLGIWLWAQATWSLLLKKKASAHCCSLSVLQWSTLRGWSGTKTKGWTMELMSRDSVMRGLSCSYAVIRTSEFTQKKKNIVLSRLETNRRNWCGASSTWQTDSQGW